MANQSGFRYTANYSSVIEGADLCEHATEKGLDQAVGYFYESDSFGYVAVFICCETCREASQQQEDAELVCCADCKKEVPQGQTIAWKWYDFYAAQGDEPIIVCKECRVADTHRARVAKDDAEYAEEMGHGDDDQDDDDDFQFEDDEDAHYPDKEETEEEEE